MLAARTPGGVGLWSVVLLAIACSGDDDDGAGGSAASSNGATSTATSASQGSSTTGADTGATTNGSGAGGAGGGAGGGTGGSGDQGGGGDGGTSGVGGDGGAAEGGASSTGTGGSGGSSGSTGSTGSGGSGGSEPQGERLRIIAANLTSGNLQAYDPGHGIRILQGLSGDVLLVQELRFGNNDAAALRSFADQVCGLSCDVEREPFGGAGDLPNGIVSRHPIVASGFWDDPDVENREFFWARIDLPGPRDLVAISVHFRTSSAPDRDAEAVALLAAMDAEVDPDDLVVLGGDFNTDVREEAVIATLSSVFVTAAPWPVDTQGIGFTSQNRSKPYDWVLGDDDLHALSRPVVIGQQGFPAGLVVDTRTFDPIADLAPALASDSGASNMQHMAVVRDFSLE